MATRWWETVSEMMARTNAAAATVAATTPAIIRTSPGPNSFDPPGDADSAVSWGSWVSCGSWGENHATRATASNRMAPTATSAGERNCRMRTLPGVPVGSPMAMRRLERNSSTTPALSTTLATMGSGTAARTLWPDGRGGPAGAGAGLAMVGADDAVGGVPGAGGQLGGGG